MGNENDRDEGDIERQYRIGATEALRMAGIPIAGALATDDEVREYCVDNFPKAGTKPLAAMMAVVSGVAKQSGIRDEELIRRGQRSIEKAERERVEAAAKQRENAIASMRPSERILYETNLEIRDTLREMLADARAERERARGGPTLEQSIARAADQIVREKGGE
jgi:hypothetical protein